jgi:sulfoacetaldehyde dehydrogenase
VLIQEGIYDEALSLLRSEGGYVLDSAEKCLLERTLWIDGHLNDKIILRSPGTIAKQSGLTSEGARRARFFVVEESGAGPEYPFSGEKLSVVLTAYKYREFEDAIRLAQSVLRYQGRGHSCGIHSSDERHVLQLAEAIDVCRVLVNQVQAVGNSGNFDNGLPFTSVLGCGSWGGNSIDENVTWRHCVNITRIARVIPERRPAEANIFGEYLRKYQ